MHSAGRAVFVVVAVIVAACSVREPQIDRAEVERIITTLAADDMQGLHGRDTRAVHSWCWWCDRG